MAADFFSKKSPATRFLTSLCNLIMVNLIFIATCIPIHRIPADAARMFWMISIKGLIISGQRHRAAASMETTI
mgnify:CR=1 FL=1